MRRKEGRSSMMRGLSGWWATLLGSIIMMCLMAMEMVRMRMRMTTRLAEVMPLDTKAAEVDTNKGKLIITITQKKLLGL